LEPTKIERNMYHKPVLLHKAIEGLNIRPEGIYADLTYGGGGHTAAILKKLGAGRVIAFDQDEDALKNKINDDRLTLIHSNFRFIRNYLRLYKALPLDGILADLGISSYQIDEGKRGFSIRTDAELDMRMNRNMKLTASQVVNNYSEQQLATMFKEYGELPFANQLAAEICALREKELIRTTGQLMNIIRKFGPDNRTSKNGAKVFQALRIEVNDELNALKEVLDQAKELLPTGGRLVIISYHSLEDRLVKNLLKTGNTDGILRKDFFGNPDLCFRQVTRKPIIPDEAEISENPRARSARLRIGERI